MPNITFNPKNPWVRRLLTENLSIPAASQAPGRIQVPRHDLAYGIAHMDGDDYLSPQEAKRYLSLEQRLKDFSRGPQAGTVCNSASFNELAKRVVVLTLGPSLSRLFAADSRNAASPSCTYSQMRGYAKALGASQPDDPALYQRVLFGLDKLQGLGSAPWKELSSAILQIRVDGKAIGSAFHVGGGFFLTARHILFPEAQQVVEIRKDEYAHVLSRHGKCSEPERIELIYFSDGIEKQRLLLPARHFTALGNFRHFSDELAVIRAPQILAEFGKLGFYLSALPLRSTPLRAKETLVVAGIPRFEAEGFLKVAILGRLSASHRSQDIELRLPGTILNQGMSGGPCLDTAGRVVGIASATSQEEGICLNLTVPELFREPLRGALAAAREAQKKSRGVKRPLAPS